MARLILCVFFIVASSLSAHADTKREIAVELVNRTINESTLLAAFKAQETLVFEMTKKELSQNFDLSGIPDSDLRAYVILQNKLAVPAIVEGLRHDLVEKFVSNLTVHELIILRRCLGGGACNRNGFSDKAKALLQGMRQYGAERGRAIGQVVGAALTPRMIEIIRANKDDQFKNPERLIELLKTPPK